MKNRTRNGLAMVCIFLSASLLSCQKENLSATETNSVVSEVPDQESPAADNLTEIDPNATGSNARVAAQSTATARIAANVKFTFTAEATNALSTLAYFSPTYWALQLKYTTYSIQRSSAYSRSGGYATRFELRKTDGDIGGSKRSETIRAVKEEPVAKVERWYGASYFLPAAYVYDAAPELVTQWHTAVGQYPPLGIWTEKGKWRIVVLGTQSAFIGNYETNKWTDFVYHVKWSTGSDGLIEIWKNGVKVFTKAGMNLNANTTTGAYMRTGIYKWPWKSGTTSSTTSRVVYIDDVRIGNASATYADVAPGS